MDRVYENIRTLRVIRGWPQKYLAEQLDISQSTYSRIECGKIDIHKSILEKIAKLYKVPLENLLYEDLAKDAQQMSEKRKKEQIRIQIAVASNSLIQKYLESSNYYCELHATFLYALCSMLYALQLLPQPCNRYIELLPILRYCPSRNAIAFLLQHLP